jgi:hypothetical protein
VNTLREVCKCGHDKVTHHEGKYNCLGMFCNNCKAYRNEWEEDAPVTDPAPSSWADDDEPSTPRMFPWP